MKKRILLVEDIASTREAYRDTLELHDFEVSEASSLTEAADIVHKKTFHVACVDLGLEEADPSNYQGQDVLREISKHKEGTRIIIVSQKGGDPALDIAIKGYEEQNLSKYLRKGQFEPEEFIQAIAEQAERAELKIFQDHGYPLSAALHGLDQDVAIHEILTALERGFPAVRELVDNSLRSLCPLRPHEDPELLLSIDADHGRVEFNLWSKAIGSAIRLVLAKADGEPVDGEVLQTRQSHQIEATTLKTSDPRDAYCC